MTKPKGKYILKSKRAVPEDDLLKWAKWFETADRKVAKDMIGDVRISTVFIGLDHSWGGDSRPLLFETMIFGGPHDHYQRRYSTREAAITGHVEALRLVTPKSVVRVAVEGIEIFAHINTDDRNLSDVLTDRLHEVASWYTSQSRERAIRRSNE